MRIRVFTDPHSLHTGEYGSVKTRICAYFMQYIFEKGASPIINRRTWISESLASIIDDILTTDIFNSSLKKLFSNIFVNTIDKKEEVF